MASDSAVEKVVASAGLSEDEVIANTGRLKPAFHHIRLAAQADELAKAKPTPGLDELLPEEVLEDLADLFWKRYHMTYRTEEEPSSSIGYKATGGIPWL